ncbi:glutamate racemase [Arcobacter sp. CECT 8983]|uniref:glutamate racemase n=1 Tax=Arcobacter sp. CECT 8983 TaxID=2044508 RepID=UPI00100B655D|nr:glutamate racemase [Arcobacter sp. CECT 8983]RXJ91881.1 glutamate racemase [Arcobacter sp. CECT 8983]
MKVGVFDSGLGGLTVVQSLANSLKGLEVFYIADTLFAPYGEKTKEQILKHSLDITNYLIKAHDIEALIVACNTATSAAIIKLREEFPNLIVIGTEPGVKPAMLISESKSIGVLATPATLGGEKYQKLLKDLSLEHEFTVYEQACKGLVEQIENGKVSHVDTHKMLTTWLEPMKERNVDTIVLGCTHYPLISHLIKEIMGANIKLIETGSAIARRLESFISNNIKDEETKIKVFYTGKIKKDMIDMILKNWEDGGQIMVRELHEQ